MNATQTLSLANHWVGLYRGLGLHPQDAAGAGVLTAELLLWLTNLPSLLWRRTFPDATTWGDAAEIATEGVLLVAASPALAVALVVVIPHLAWLALWDLLAGRRAVALPEPIYPAARGPLPVALPAGLLPREDGVPVATPVAEPVRLLAYASAPEQGTIAASQRPTERRSPRTKAKPRPATPKPARKPRSVPKAKPEPMPAAARCTVLAGKADQVAEAKRLIAGGMSRRGAAAAVGLAESTLRTLLKRDG